MPPSDGDAEAAEAAAAAAEAAAAAAGSKSNATALPFSFEIFSANRKGEMLQASGLAELTEWTAAIRNCIEKQLETGEAQSGEGARVRESVRMRGCEGVRECARV